MCWSVRDLGVFWEEVRQSCGASSPSVILSEEAIEKSFSLSTCGWWTSWVGFSKASPGSSPVSSVSHQLVVCLDHSQLCLILTRAPGRHEWTSWVPSTCVSHEEFPVILTLGWQPFAAFFIHSCIQSVHLSLASSIGPLPDDLQLNDKYC